MTLNFGTYLYWWNVPLDVGCPIRIFTADQGDGGAGSKIEEGVGDPRPTERPLLEWAQELDMESWMRLVVGAHDRDANLSDITEVPRFWSGQPTKDQILIANVITLMVGGIFGAVHCVAWPFSFLSHTELILWRISCIAMVAGPVYILLCSLVLSSNFDLRGLMPSVVYLLVIMTPLLPHLITRAVTVVLAFNVLRALPAAAYETVHWTTFIFIPHV